MRALRRLAVVVLMGATLALGALGGRPAATSAEGLNHAAVVVDTGEGKVRKFCLAFPEESITGADALRRIESDAVFASYGGKGQAVCALCGVGCPSGDCFCDRSKFWAYHRAGPGGAPYTYARAGVSSTTVQDGDVEGWRWGAGEAPARATVGEVCDVPEPAVRTASASPATTSPPPEPATTTPAGERDGPAASPTTAAPPATGGGGTIRTVPAAPAGSATVTSTTTGAESTVPGPVEDATPTTAPVDEGEGDLATTGSGSGGDALAAPLAPPVAGTSGGRPGNALGLVAFVGVLGAVLGWRVRLRRANMRRASTVQ